MKAALRQQAVTTPAASATVPDDVEVRPVSGRRELKTFIRLPWVLHGDDPTFCAPLDMEVRKQLSPKHNPFFAHAETRLFLAWRDGAPVGRISAHIDHEHNERHDEATGMFGFFDAQDDAGVAAALIQTAREWVAARGMDRLRGPLSWSLHEYVGTLVKGFDTPPMIMMGHNPAYHDTILQATGLRKAKDIWCWRYHAGSFPEKIFKLYELTKKDPKLVIRTIDMKRFDEELRTVFHIYNEAWKENWGFVPISETEIRAVASDLKLVIDPRMALIAEVEGKPAAMGIAIPNIHEASRPLQGRSGPLALARLLYRLKIKGLSSARLMLLGILPEYRGAWSLPLLMGLYGRMNEQGERYGYGWGELSWTLEDNERINESIAMTGADHYKTYRIYEMPV